MFFDNSRIEEIYHLLVRLHREQHEQSKQLQSILQQQETLMAASDKLQASVDTLTGIVGDAATAMGNAATRIDALIDEVRNGTPGIPEDQADAFASKLDALGANLKTASDALSAHAATGGDTEGGETPPPVEVPPTDTTEGETSGSAA